MRRQRRKWECRDINRRADGDVHSKRYIRCIALVVVETGEVVGDGSLLGLFRGVGFADGESR